MKQDTLSCARTYFTAWLLFLAPGWSAARPPSPNRPTFYDSWINNDAAACVYMSLQDRPFFLAKDSSRAAHARSSRSHIAIGCVYLCAAVLIKLYMRVGWEHSMGAIEPAPLAQTDNAECILANLYQCVIVARLHFLYQNVDLRGLCVGEENVICPYSCRSNFI